jgi:hypothetical protein
VGSSEPHSSSQLRLTRVNLERTLSPVFCFEGVADVLPVPPQGEAVEAVVLSQLAPPLTGLEPLLENCRASTSILNVLPSYKEPTVDALASRTDEGRG